MSYLADFRYCFFVVTYTCNYHCEYCFWPRNQSRNQSKEAYLLGTHSPRLPKNLVEKALFRALRSAGILKKADAFDNYSLEQWVDLFRKVFAGKIAYISFAGGGEPMLHYRKLVDIMSEVAEVSKDCLFRFDTNGSIIPDFPQKLRPRITYNVSYHKAQAGDFSSYIERLIKLSKQGRVLMVNRVVASESELADAVGEMKTLNDFGYFMNINPAFFNVSSWKQENQNLLRKLIHPKDYALKFEGKTKGEHCIYPKFGFQLLPNGYAWIPPCDSSHVMNLMKTKNVENLLHTHGMSCPVSNCVCIHQYSFAQPLLQRNAAGFGILGNFRNSQEDYRKTTGIIA